MNEPARKYFFLVFCFQIAIIGMQVYSMGQDTWWYCDLTTHGPTVNGNKTLNSTHTVEISIKMRTSLEDTCWYVKLVDESKTENDTFTSRLVTKCMTALYDSLTSSKIRAIDKARADVFGHIRKCIIANSIFIGFGLFISIITICNNCTPCTIIANQVVLLISIICTLISVILAATRIEYDAEFNIIDIGFLRVWVIKDPSLTTAGKALLITLFEGVEKSDVALRSRYSKGQSFVFLWVTLIFVIVAFVVSLLSLGTWVNTDAGETVIESNKIDAEGVLVNTVPKKKRFYHSFTDHYHWYWWPSLPSLPTLPLMSPMPSLSSMPSLPSFEDDDDFGDDLVGV